MDDELVDISTSVYLQLGYGVGHVLNDVCASLWFTYLLVFLHLVLEFSASQAGILMLIGQIVDALFTPFIGYHSDHTENVLCFKYGKRKIWHLFGTACVLGSFPFIFTECLGCSTSHKWAQMFYFASFIMIFQIGWASVQISHLSLIPELAEDEQTRTYLTAVRFGFTVFSNLFVYIITWIVLHVTGECDKEQVGPTDAWKFQRIVYIMLAVGILASITFHMIVKEKQPYRRQESIDASSDTHRQFLKKCSLYQVSIVYMCTRLVVNVSQVLVPLYLHRSLGLAARMLATVPLAMYLGSLSAAAAQRFTPSIITRKVNYAIGSLCSLTAFFWTFFDCSYNYKVYFIYIVAVLIGFGGAIMLITSLALTADLVGTRTEASAFVYGFMSFTDKLSCGIVIAVIQMYADTADNSYYREVLSWACASATVAGLVFTLFLPNFTNPAQLLNDNNITTVGISSDEQEA